MMELERLTKAYDELLPWEKSEFCEWVKTRPEFEIDTADLYDMELNLDDIADHFTDDELLSVCDEDSVMDYVFEHGMEEDILAQYSSERLADYIKKYCPEVIDYLSDDDKHMKAPDKIYINNYNGNDTWGSQWHTKPTTDPITVSHEYLRKAAISEWLKERNTDMELTGDDYYIPVRGFIEEIIKKFDL